MCLVSYGSRGTHPSILYTFTVTTRGEDGSSVELTVLSERRPVTPPLGSNHGTPPSEGYGLFLWSQPPTNSRPIFGRDGTSGGVGTRTRGDGDPRRDKDPERRRETKDVVEDQDLRVGEGASEADGRAGVVITLTSESIRGVLPGYWSRGGTPSVF